MIAVAIPADLWAELRHEGLIEPTSRRPDGPLRADPGGRRGCPGRRGRFPGSPRSQRAECDSPRPRSPAPGSSTWSRTTTSAGSSPGRTAPRSSRRTGLERGRRSATLSFNRARGHAPRDALPGRAARRRRSSSAASRGAIFDVIVDMRPDSPTYLQHFGVELRRRRAPALYVPGDVRRRLPDPRRRHRGDLPGERDSTRPAPSAASATTTRPSAIEWPLPGRRLISEKDACLAAAATANERPVIIVDKALRARAEAGDPVRVGMIGAGFMARGIANSDPQLVPRDAPGGDREPHRVDRACGPTPRPGSTPRTSSRSSSRGSSSRTPSAPGRYAVTDDPIVVCRRAVGRGHPRGHRDHRVRGARASSGRSSTASTSS